MIPCSGKEPGRIIGKGGATINRIQDETGARIDILRDEQSCVISGSAAAVAAALSTVRLLMSEGDGPPGPWSDRGTAREVRQGVHGGDFKEEMIPCTGLGPGRVIGKRGATVMRLQDETGARIEVRPEDGQCFISAGGWSRRLDVSMSPRLDVTTLDSFTMSKFDSLLPVEAL